MSSSPFELSVQSADPLAIVEIANGTYSLVAQGEGRVSHRAEPGLYIARVKHKDRVEERIVRHGAEDQLVSFDTPTMTPAASLVEQAGQVLARHIHDSRAAAGLTSWITIAIKGIRDAESGALSTPGFRPSDFEVCGIDGTAKHVFDAATIEQAAPVDSENSVYPGEVASVDVPVGWYALAMPGPAGARVLLPLFVSNRFSPTIFVETKVDLHGVPWLDFDRLLVSYDAHEFDSYTDPLRLRAIEMARRSLELGRNNLTKSLMNVLLQQKFQDPTLGLLALQLLLLDQGQSSRPPSDALVSVGETLPSKNARRSEATKKAAAQEAERASMFNIVMQHMVDAFDYAEHPDLVIARAQARKKKWSVPQMPGDDEPLTGPPLLRASWNNMICMPNRSREVARKRTLLHDVGHSLLCAGVWVIWKQVAHASDDVQVRARIASPGWRDYLTTVVGPPLSDAVETVAMTTPARAPRSADALLEKAVDLVRAHDFLQTEMREGLLANPLFGTVLDRAVVKTVLQLANFESDNDQSVPRGYSSQMAKSFTLPLPMVTDSISRVQHVLAKRVSLGDAVQAPENESIGSGLLQALSPKIGAE